MASNYELIAGALRSTKPEFKSYMTVSTGAKREQWELDCDRVAIALAETNPRFDRHRFLAACGVETVATEAHAIRKEGTIRERLLGGAE